MDSKHVPTEQIMMIHNLDLLIVILLARRNLKIYLSIPFNKNINTIRKRLLAYHRLDIAEQESSANNSIHKSYS